MLVIILAAALLLALAGLAVEIGIASWCIRKAKRSQRLEDNAVSERNSAVRSSQESCRELKSWKDYAVKVSWLLHFLYKRYDSFNDIEKEFEIAKQNAQGDAEEDACAKYAELKKAKKIVQTTVKASLLGESALDQISQIIKSFADDDDDDDDFDNEREKPSASEEDPEKTETAN